MRHALTSFILFSHLALLFLNCKARVADGSICILYYTADRPVEVIQGADRCQVGLPPASTFKVPLALMAFDSGMLKDTEEIIAWDGKPGLLPAWDADQNARTWMRHSVVWFSQVLVRRMGKDLVARYLRKLNYGNGRIDRGLDSFWLARPDEAGGLLITGQEQMAFWQQFWQGKLSVSPTALTMAQDITLIEERADGSKLWGKTGSNWQDAEKKKRLGWFLGRTVHGGREHLIVVNFSDDLADQTGVYGGPRAREIALETLKSRQAW